MTLSAPSLVTTAFSCVMAGIVSLAAAKPASKPAAVNLAPSVASPERPLSDGAVSFKLGTKSLTLKTVGGSIQTSGPYQIASVKFSDGSSFPKLQLDFMYEGTGPVDQITNVFAIDDGKQVSSFRAKVSTCAITLAKATPSLVEGTATCPKGMFNDEKPGKPITDISFRAESKP